MNESYVENTNIKNLQNNYNGKLLLKIVSRKILKEANDFFKKFVKKPFEVNNQVHKKTSLEDIKNLLTNSISDNLLDNTFYNFLIRDMSNLCNIFCDVMGTNAISFSLGTHRGCKRYHIDNVPKRLLVTYYGRGTEWLPYESSNYKLYFEGAKNEDIIKDHTAKKFLNTWDIALFKGVKKRILHRTPDDALNNKTILMRLNHESYLKDIESFNKLIELKKVS